MSRRKNNTQTNPLGQKKIVGIDNGTTQTKMAVLTEDGRVEVIRLEGKDLEIPSVMFIRPDGTAEFGDRARRMALTNPLRYFQEFKRLVGETNSDGSPLTVDCDPDSGRETSIEDLHVRWFGYLKETLTRCLGDEAAGVVITVPAYFRHDQRTQVEETATKAGFNVLRIIDEPVAGALAYVHLSKKEGLIVVFDMGGGTLDVTVLRVSGDSLHILATHGDSKLGGCDLDMAISAWGLCEFQAQHGFSPDPVDDAREFFEYHLQVQQARHDLSQYESATIVARFQSKQVVLELTRGQFNRLAETVVAKAMAIAKESLTAANLEPSEIDFVLTIGGATHTPCVIEALEKTFGVPVLAAPNREFKVVEGAALSAVQEAAKDKELAPLVRSLPSPNLQLFNKTAHPLSIAIVDEAQPDRKMSHIMIPAQSSIPAETTERFTPVSDMQLEVCIEVTQCPEGKAVEGNDVIYQLNLRLLPLPKSERRESIQVTYRFDENSIIHVVGKDLKTGLEVTGKSTLGIPSLNTAY